MAVSETIAQHPPGPGYDRGVFPVPQRGPLGLRRFLRMIRDNEISVFGQESFVNEMVQGRIAFQWFATLNKPEFIEHVLLTNHRNYDKGRLNRQILGPVLGEGLLTAEGDAWRRQRRATAPAFHRRRIEAAATVMTLSAEAAVERLRPAARAGQPVEIMPEMMALTMDIIGRALFSRDLGPSVFDLGAAVSTIIHSFGKPSPLDLLGLPEWLPRHRAPEAKRAVAQLDAMIDGIIAEGRARQEEGDDLLAMLIDYRDEEGRGFGDRALRDQIMTLFAAGHETTGVALTWVFYLLSQHPEVEARLHEELDTVLGGRLPEVADLERLDYARKVIDETLRLFPPAFAINRFSLGPDRIGSHDIRPDTLITISPYVTQRSPLWWEDPLRFDPERFAPGTESGRHRFAYFPFGGGPRVCIGNTFALMEARLVLATLAQAYRMRLAPGHPVEAQGLITLRPRHGMKMILEPRGKGL
jgi:cytochrome P450